MYKVITFLRFNMTMLIRNLLVVLLSIFHIQSHGQCVDFDLNPNGCINQQLRVLNNQSSGNFRWDFCAGDLLLNPTSTQVMTLANSSEVRGIDIIYDAPNWYGFVTGRTSNNLVRLEFGADIQSNPEEFDLGNIDGLLDGPEPIKIIKENNQWYGLIHNGVGESIISVDFGASLDNDNPSATILLSSVGSVSSNFDIGYTNDSLIIVLANRNSTVTSINLGNTITNIPEPSDYFTTSTTANSTTSMSLIQDCGQWYGVSQNVFGGNLYLISFGNSPFNTPIATELGVNLFGSDSPNHVWIEKDENSFLVFAIMSNGNFWRVNIGNDLLAPVVIGENLGSLGGLNRTFSLTLKKVNSQWTSFSLDRLFRRLYRIDFPSICNASRLTSTEIQPSEVSFNESGNYTVSLQSLDNNDQVVGEIFKTVSVASSVAPLITIGFDNICVGSSINFMGNSNEVIVSSSWNFGDGTSSTNENPSHSYPVAGDYEVTLEVSDGTCENFVRQTITIFDEPVPVFSPPTGVICTNQQLTIVNGTTGDFGGNESWEWQIDGVPVSTSRDLDFSFSSSGMQEIKLIATIPGCSVEFTQNVSVQEGPTPSFTVDDACVGTLMQFSNTTTGTFDISTWDFDNGFTSSLESPAFEFPEEGTYNVALTVENSLGCISTFVTPVTVFASPQVQFANELSCEQNLTQFNDLSTVANANLDEWRWDFGDPGSASNSSANQNATHIFSSSGAFDVKLVTTSSFGCQDSLTQTVNVLAAPQADFTFDRACLGEPVQFQDTSTPVPGENIVSYEWDLGGTFSSIQNPNTVFPGPAEYEVTLFVTSENLCPGSVTKTINIAEAPDLAIGTGLRCENEPVQFFDLSQTNNDPIVGREWNFDNLGTATDSLVFFRF